MRITGGPQAPKLSSGARAGPPSPPPPRVGRVNQSCLTADMWFHSVIRYLPGQKGQSTATGCAILRHPAPSGAWWRKKVARKVNVYTRHIRNTKGQRSGHGVYTTNIQNYIKHYTYLQTMKQYYQLQLLHQHNSNKLD